MLNMKKKSGYGHEMHMAKKKKIPNGNFSNNVAI